MKKTVAFLFFSLLCSLAFSQDRRGFKGTITSELKQTVEYKGTKEVNKSDEKIKTEIRFTGRTVMVGGDTYEIIKRSFDGENTTLFTCTKRRGTYEITYIPGKQLKLVDTNNKSEAVIYASLAE